MKSVRLYNPLDLRFETVNQAPDPGPNEVRVRVAYAGICGSDIHNYKTGQWISRSPSIAGHEFSGWIEATGEGVCDLSIGDKVIADSRYYCGKCHNCKTDMQHLCETLGFIGEAIDGGFAELITLPAKLIVKCDPKIPLDIAALAEPLAVSLHALNRMNIPDDEPLLIIGCGPIGALAALASRQLSGRPLGVMDINQERMETVANLSAASIFKAAKINQFDNPFSRPIRYVLDTTGNIGVISSLVQNMNGCTIGLVGIGTGSLDIEPTALVEREISLVGCHAFSSELTDAVQMLNTAPALFKPIIGSVISLEETPPVFKAIADGKAKGIKTLIKVQDDCG